MRILCVDVSTYVRVPRPAARTVSAIAVLRRIVLHLRDPLLVAASLFVSEYFIGFLYCLSSSPSSINEVDFSRMIFEIIIAVLRLASDCLNSALWFLPADHEIV